MWYELTTTGKYRFREHCTDPVTGKTRTVSVTMDRCTKQAQRIARQLLAEKMQEPVKEKTMILSQLVELYLNDQKRIVKASTLTSTETILKSLVKTLGNVPIDRLTAGYVRRKLLDSGREAGTCNEFLTRLKALLRWGYKNDFIQDIRFLDKLDPFKDIPHRQKIQNKFLEKSELTVLVDAMRIDQWKDLTLFLALSGLRIGEAAALTRKDMDLSARTIEVNKTLDFVNMAVTDPKTYRSNRTVYMQDELYNLCRIILTKDKIVYMSDLVFSQGGGYVSYYTYNKYLKSVSQEVLGRKITPHVLRHTHASLLMEAGMDIDTISARLGHADSKVTKEIYLHVTKKLEDERNQKLKEVKFIEQNQ